MSFPVKHGGSFHSFCMFTRGYSYQDMMLLEFHGISAFGFIQLQMQTNRVISSNYSVITCNYTMSCGIELIASPKGFVEESAPCAPQPPGLKASWTAAPFKHTLTHYRKMEGFQGPTCLHSSASGTIHAE